MTNAYWIDWIGLLLSIFTLIIAAYAAKTALNTLQNQRTTNDIGLALNLFEKINSYWDRTIETTENKGYFIGQILTYFETAAGLFNRNILSRDALDILRDHIIEVWLKINSTPSGQELMKELQSSETTFSELKKFLKENHTKALAQSTFNESPYH